MKAYGRFRQIARGAVFLAFSAMLAFFKFGHAPWRDEADSWLLARDGSAADWLYAFGYTGHPPLWYLVLLPFARMGLPYEAMTWIHFCIVICAAGLLIYRSPLPLPMTACYLFSIHLLWWHGIIVRGYALMLLLLFSSAATFARRHQAPLRHGISVGLLSLTEFFAIPMAAAFGLVFLWETVNGMRLAKPNPRDCPQASLERRAVALLVMVLCGAVSVISLIPPSDAVGVALVSSYHPGSFVERFAEGFLPRLIDNLGFCLGIVILGSALIATADCMAAFLVLTAGVAGCWYVFAYRYGGGPWHSALFAPMLLTALWLALAEKTIWGPGCKRLAFVTWQAGMYLSLGVSVWAAKPYLAVELHTPYSGASAMAAFIAKQHLDDRLIATDTCYITRAVVAFLPHTAFWDMPQGRVGRYFPWDGTGDRCAVTNSDFLLEWIFRFASEPERSLFLTSVPVPDPQQYGLKLVAETKGAIESFWLYSLRGKCTE